LRYPTSAGGADIHHMHHRAPRVIAAALAAVGVFVLVGAAGLLRPQGASAHNRSFAVVLTGSNVNQLTASHPTLRGFFDNRAVYALGNPAGDQIQAVAVPLATPTLIFRSYAAFAAEVAASKIDPRVQAVAYDPERWTYTPAIEQANPVIYMKRFASLARRHGYEVIIAPGRDLMAVPHGSCHARSGERLDDAYLRCGIAASAARVADVLEVQSQVDEFSTSRFRALLQGAVVQSHSANPRVKVLAGLSTQPASGTATLAVMVAAAKIATEETDGIWVNIFSTSATQKRTGGFFFRWLAQHER
jgi:hypothetical protein